MGPHIRPGEPDERRIEEAHFFATAGGEWSDLGPGTAGSMVWYSGACLLHPGLPCQTLPVRCAGGSAGWRDDTMVAQSVLSTNPLIPRAPSSIGRAVDF